MDNSDLVKRLEAADEYFSGLIRSEAISVTRSAPHRNTVREAATALRSGSSRGGVTVKPLEPSSSEVRVGDTVRILRCRNLYGEEISYRTAKPYQPGETFVVGKVETNAGWPCPLVFPVGVDTDFWRADDLSPQEAGEPVAVTEDDIWLLASAAENLRGGSQNEERRVDAARRIAGKLDDLRRRITAQVDAAKAATLTKEPGNG